jgi:hypothetical protein
MVTIIKKGTDKITIQKAFDSVITRKGMDAYKYCGKVKLEKDSLTIQKKLRDEWE